MVAKILVVFLVVSYVSVALSENADDVCLSCKSSLHKWWPYPTFGRMLGTQRDAEESEDMKPFKKSDLLKLCNCLCDLKDTRLSKDLVSLRAKAFLEDLREMKPMEIKNTMEIFHLGKFCPLPETKNQEEPENQPLAILVAKDPKLRSQVDQIPKYSPKVLKFSPPNSPNLYYYYDKDLVENFKEENKAGRKYLSTPALYSKQMRPNFVPVTYEKKLKAKNSQFEEFHRNELKKMLIYNNQKPLSPVEALRRYLNFENQQSFNQFSEPIYSHESQPVIVPLSAPLSTADETIYYDEVVPVVRETIQPVYEIRPERIDLPSSFLAGLSNWAARRYQASLRGVGHRRNHKEAPESWRGKHQRRESEPTSKEVVDFPVVVMESTLEATPATLITEENSDENIDMDVPEQLASEADKKAVETFDPILMEENRDESNDDYLADGGSDDLESSENAGDSKIREDFEDLKESIPEQEEDSQIQLPVNEPIQDEEQAEELVQEPVKEKEQVEELVQEPVQENEQVEELVQEPVQEEEGELVPEAIQEQVEELVQEPVQEQEGELVPEAIQEQVEELVQEPVQEQAEELVPEAVQEQQEQAEELVPEAVQEQAEEPVQEPVQEQEEELVQEPVQEQAEELVQEPVQEQAVELLQEPVKELEPAEELVQEPEHEIEQAEELVQEPEQEQEQVPELEPEQEPEQDQTTELEEAIEEYRDYPREQSMIMLEVLRWYTNVAKALADYNAAVLYSIQLALYGGDDPDSEIPKLEPAPFPRRLLERIESSSPRKSND